MSAEPMPGQRRAIAALTSRWPDLSWAHDPSSLSRVWAPMPDHEHHRLECSIDGAGWWLLSLWYRPPGGAGVYITSAHINSQWGVPEAIEAIKSNAGGYRRAALACDALAARLSLDEDVSRGRCAPEEGEGEG